MDNSNFVITTVSIMFIAVVFAVVFGVQDANKKYYAAMDKCVEASGTWIPTTNTGACIIMKDKK